MKKDIHPTVNPVVFVDTSCKAEFVTTSTMKNDKTRTIEGVEHFVIPIEISSKSHPFYTGKQVLIDTARRVEKFEARMKKVDDTAKDRKGKKAKNAARRAKKTQDETPAPKAKAKKPKVAKPKTESTPKADKPVAETETQPKTKTAATEK